MTAIPNGSLPADFFDRNTHERAEVIEGLLCEGQLAAFAGPFGMGKSPMLADLTIHLVNGLEWCGRKLAQRPVIVFDCETGGPEYRRQIKAIAARVGVSVPDVPSQLDVYLERDHPSEPQTKELLRVVSESGHVAKLDLIKEALGKKPNAVVLIDPLEMLFRLDTGKKSEVLQLYRDLRMLLAEYPRATILMTFNLRKKDRRDGRAGLLAAPRDWLEEVCGSLDILNRSDVRLGIDLHADEVRVVNGIVRGREMHPLLIRPVAGADDQLAGFERVTPGRLDLVATLTLTQITHWYKLPSEFKFESVADSAVPRSTLSRLIKATTNIGALKKDADGFFRKVEGEGAGT